jgi:hypothetical protein
MISRRKAAQPDNFDILTCSLHLSMVMNHKTACYELMRYAKSVTVEMRLQYYIFTLEKSLQSLERIEQKSVEGLKFDEIVMQFSNSHPLFREVRTGRTQENHRVLAGEPGGCD